ncbi:MAG: restriction endonuclease [Polyangiaceae bacterium]|nr:restriction endonuclease [Polyangiaceae bacterium]
MLMKRGELFGSTTELAGYKSGLALTHQEVADILPPEFHVLWNGEADVTLRVRPGEYEELFTAVLRGLGTIPDGPDLTPGLELQWRYGSVPKLWAVARDVLDGWSDDIRTLFLSGRSMQGIKYDPGPLAKRMEKKHGTLGLAIVLELVQLIDAHQHRSPWTRVRSIEWNDSIALAELFETQGISASHGTFFDQRYIDFLHQNFHRIDDINWRRFEALTCEFFEREGFHVDIGPGSNDDGVDARIWSKDERAYPHLIVQCKRQKSKVGKVVVKALYADVLHERASAGLIVTTSTLSPGSEETRTAREYPVQVADRVTLQTWLDKMRTPRTGIFLAM